MSEKDSVVQVVLAVYDPDGSYSCFAGVVMTSLFANTGAKVRVTILHDATLSGENRRRLEQTAALWKQEVSFLDVSDHISRIAADGDKIVPSLSQGSLFRILIPDLLLLPRVIYLDCDIVVNLDIAKLWNAPLEDSGKSLAAIRQRLVFDGHRVAALYMRIREWIVGYATADYFNSGVLVMDLNRIREKYPAFVSEAFHFPGRFASRYSQFTRYLDQDFLNMFFAGDVLYLDKRFNEVDERRNVDNSILHPIGRNKPWKRPENTPRDVLFWAAFLKSGFAAEEYGADWLAGTIAALYRGRPLSSYSAWDCAKSALSRLPVISWLMPEKIARFFSLLREIWNRLRR